MKKYFIALIAVAALIASTMPVSADTAFNDMSKCIKNWGKECKSGTSTAAKTMPKAKSTTDTLGNKIPTSTDNSGKTKLGT